MTQQLINYLRETLKRKPQKPQYVGRHWAHHYKKPLRVQHIIDRITDEWEQLRARARQANEQAWAGIYYSKNVRAPRR